MSVGINSQVTKERKVEGRMSYMKSTCSGREKKKKKRNKKEEGIPKEIFQASGQHSSGVDLQHGRGGRGQLQACETFAGRRCHFSHVTA